MCQVIFSPALEMSFCLSCYLLNYQDSWEIWTCSSFCWRSAESRAGLPWFTGTGWILCAENSVFFLLCKTADIFRCASISCTDYRHSLTDSLTDQNWRLTILHVWQFSHHPSRILAGENICLISLVSLVSLISLISQSGLYGHPVLSVQSGQSGQSGFL